MKNYIVTLISLSAFLFLSCQQNIMPIITESDEARQAFLTGRDLTEKLRGQEALAYFERAVELDTNFALAYANLAANQTTAKEAFFYLDKAMAKLDHVSDGEKLFIQAINAGFNGLPARQGEYIEQLVELYPNDPRTNTLLGNYYFSQQRYEEAIRVYKTATSLDPDFSTPYNQLGYSYRFLGDYAQAEASFKKYINLLPDDPNPYDSYAELLLKMGEFEISIEMYEKAIDINPKFYNSYYGLATNYNLKEEHREARKKLKELMRLVETDGQRRQAITAMAISYIDEEKYPEAVKLVEERLVIANRNSDTLAMAGDLNFIALILLENEQIEQAGKTWQKMHQLVQQTSRAEDVKNIWYRAYLYGLTRIAIELNDFEQAVKNQKAFLQAAEKAGNSFQVRVSHQLAGLIYMQQKKYIQAIAELQQANRQNAYDQFRLAMAYEGNGDTANALQNYHDTANANLFNNANYAFCRKRAESKYAFLKSVIN